MICCRVIATLRHSRMAASDGGPVDSWSLNKPVQISPDKVFKPFFDNLRLNSANFSLVWQAEEMNMPEGTLSDVEEYFKKYLASHRTTTILPTRSMPADDHYTFTNIKSDAIDSGIEDAHDPQRAHSIRCTETQLIDKEYGLYRHALLCAQFPILSRDPVKPPFSSPPLPPSPFSLSSIVFATPPLSPLSPLSPSIMSRSFGSGGGGNWSDEGENLVQEETLCCVVREAFRLTEESHLGYYKAISDGFGGKPPAKILVEELHGRLYLIENHTHPIYHQRAFHICDPDEEQQERLSSIAYELWQQEERMRVHSFISQFWTGPLPPPNSGLCKPQYWTHMPHMYKDLLIKLLRHDELVEGASNQTTILHSSSRRLLREFALRYGVSDIFQRAVFLEHLCEEENFVLDRGFLKTVLTGMARLRDLLLPAGGQCYILKSDLELSVRVLSQIRTRCESKLQVMLQKSLNPHTVDLLLTILSETINLLSDVSEDVEQLGSCIEKSIKKCFTNWFNQERLQLTTQLHLNSYSTPVSAELISKLVIWVQSEVLDYQQKYFAVFESYSVDINKAACNCYYKRLMVDVQQLNNHMQADVGSPPAGSTMDLITLARRLDKLGQDWCHVITPSQETWRYLFIRLAHRWLKQIREDLYQLIRRSIEQDKCSGMQAPVLHEGSRGSRQRTLTMSGNFSPSFGSAFQSVSPPGEIGSSLVCTIQPAHGERDDPFLVEGSRHWGGPSTGGKQRDGASDGSQNKDRVKIEDNMDKAGRLADPTKVGASSSDTVTTESLHQSVIESADRIRKRDESALNALTADPMKVGDSQAGAPSSDTVTTESLHQSVIGGADRNSAHNALTSSGMYSSGYGTSFHTRTPAISSVTSSFLQSGVATLSYSQSHSEESAAMVTAPFSGSVFDFLTMMSCTSQFLKDLCVVLCPESKDFLAAGDSDALRQRLESQQAQCMMGRNDDASREQEELRSSEGVAETLAEILLRSPKEILDVLMPVYAGSLLYIDLCSTAPTVTEGILPEGVLDFVNGLQDSGHLPRCRHKRAGIANCNIYVNRRDDYICDRFEPITPEMCVRVNNVETLLSSKTWLFQNQPMTHPFLTQRGEEEGGMHTLLEDLYHAQIKLLAHKLNLVLEQSMRVLLAVNTGSSNMQPYYSSLHKHLVALSLWLYPSSYHQFCLDLWQMIIRDILLLVKEMSKLVVDSEHYAMHLIQFVSKLIKQFTFEPYGKLSTEECWNVSQPLLRILELYTQPTSTIISTYHKILAQNWSSSYLNSESGFLTQELLDHLSSKLHQMRKCFTSSQLTSVLEEYAEEIEHSSNYTKEEWMRGVIEEMMERNLLHSVTTAPSSASSPMDADSSAESEPYTFPEVTILSFTEQELISSSASSSPAGHKPLLDVRTILSSMREAGLSTGASTSFAQGGGWGKEESSDEGEARGEVHLTKEEGGTLDSEFTETQGVVGKEGASGGFGTGNPGGEVGKEGFESTQAGMVGSGGEGESAQGELRDTGLKEAVVELEGDLELDLGEACEGRGITGDAPEGASRTGTEEESQGDNAEHLSHGTDDVDGPNTGVHQDAEEEGHKSSRADGSDSDSTLGEYQPIKKSSQEDKVGAPSDIPVVVDPGLVKEQTLEYNMDAAVRPKERNSYWNNGKETRSGSRDYIVDGKPSDGREKKIKEGDLQWVDQHRRQVEPESTGAGEVAPDEGQYSGDFVIVAEDLQSSDTQNSEPETQEGGNSGWCGHSKLRVRDILAEMEENSLFYRLSLPLQMQADGLQLGTGVSNTDVLLDILSSRRRHDQKAREFVQSLGNITQWRLCPLC